MGSAIIKVMRELNFKKVNVGARWDDQSQAKRFRRAISQNLLDYVEVNYPISVSDNPYELGLPILAHTSNNGLCSFHGVDLAVSSKVKEGADQSNSAWVGEHLSLLGYAPSGALGYVINPLFIKEVFEVTVKNINFLKEYYGRPLALELGPLYDFKGEFKNEIEFLSKVAHETNSFIIFDVTHWLISNKNLKRGMTYGLESLDFDRVIELHVAGMRKSKSEDFWHDAHAMPVSDEVHNVSSFLIKQCQNLKAVTIEYAPEGNDESFFECAEKVRRSLL
jgi:uncharacterized protein (UPF0276 family)